MATITNNERGPITLQTGEVIPRLGTLTTDNATIRHPGNWPNLSGRALAGQISIAFDPEPDPADTDVVRTEVVTPPAPTAVLDLIETDPPLGGKPKPAKG